MHTPDAALPDLATRINAAHAAAEQHARTAVAHAIAAGELLTQAKAQVEHGAWLDWLTANCTLSERTAQAYMRVAKKLSKLDNGKAQRVADMPLRQALEHLVECDDDDDLATGENEQARTDTEADDEHPAQEIADQQPAGAPPRQGKLSRSERIAEITKLAEEGYRAAQIAESLGISVNLVKSIAKNASITLPDKAIGRARAIDPRRVVESIVYGLSGTVMSLKMVNVRDIDASKDELDGWTKELAAGIAGLRKLNTELNRLAAAAALRDHEMTD